MDTTNSSENPQRRVEDRKPAEVIDWAAPGAPAIPADSAAGSITTDQISAGAAILCDHGTPIGRNAAIDVFDAMSNARAAPAATSGDAPDLRAAILSLPCEADPALGSIAVHSYKRGHAEARQAAADLVARIESAAAPAPSEYRKLTGDLTLKELAAEFCAVADLGGDVTLSAGACRKLFDAMTTPPAASPSTASGDELPAGAALTLTTPNSRGVVEVLWVAREYSSQKQHLYTAEQVRAAVSAATKPTADLKKPEDAPFAQPGLAHAWACGFNACLASKSVNVFPTFGSDSAGDELQNLFDEYGNSCYHRRSDKYEIRDKFQSLLATKPAAAPAVPEELRKALQTVARWELPPTGKTWDDGSPMSYAACYGSNGERDYMRQVALNALAASPAASTPAAPVEPVELMGVREEIEAGSGFWHTCSGCHETEDGHPVGRYHYSEAMRCALGAGCSECGGIGAVWDNNDYEAMARDWDKPDAASTTGAAQTAEQVRDQALEDAAEFVEGCDKRATLRGIACAIRALKRPTPTEGGQ